METRALIEQLGMQYQFGFQDVVVRNGPNSAALTSAFGLDTTIVVRRCITMLGD
jgi:hypothetical protein